MVALALVGILLTGISKVNATSRACWFYNSRLTVEFSNSNRWNSDHEYTAMYTPTYIVSHHKLQVRLVS